MTSDATPSRNIRVRAPERWIRVAVYFVALLAVNLWTETIGHFWALWPTRPGSAARVRRGNFVIRQWGSLSTRLTLSVLKSRLDVVGRVPEGRFIVVSNHQSTADITILIWALSSLNCRFVAKKQLGRGQPAVAMMLHHFGSSLISRDGSRQDLVRMKTMAAGLETWQGSAIVFAESTRSRDGSLLPYKSAAVRIIAKESGLPLLPIAIDGTHVASDLPGFARDMPGAVGRVTIGEPIPPEAYKGRIDEAVEDIRRWTHAIIEEGRRTGAVPPPPGWSPEAFPTGSADTPPAASA